MRLIRDKHKNNQTGFQTWIGYADIKSSPTYFYVQRSSNFHPQNTPVTFDIVRINVGEAMNAGSGIFTAPRTGKYFFSFSGVGYMESTGSDGDINLVLVFNNNNVGTARAHFNQGINWQTYSLQATLNLQAGDQVWVKIGWEDNDDNVWLSDNGNHYTHFTGYLLQEDVW